MATIKQCDKCQTKINNQPIIISLDDLNNKTTTKAEWDLCDKCFQHVHKWLGTKEKKTFFSKVIEASKGVTNR